MVHNNVICLVSRCQYCISWKSVCIFDRMVFLSFFQEGSNHDRGLYVRCFEELFDLANSDMTATSQFDFSVTAFELRNEQVILLSAYWLSISMGKNYKKYVTWFEVTVSWFFQMDRFLALIGKGFTFRIRENFTKDPIRILRIFHRTESGEGWQPIGILSSPERCTSKLGRWCC